MNTILDTKARVVKLKPFVAEVHARAISPQITEIVCDRQAIRVPTAEYSAALFDGKARVKQTYTLKQHLQWVEAEANNVHSITEAATWSEVETILSDLI